MSAPNTIFLNNQTRSEPPVTMKTSNKLILLFVFLHLTGMVGSKITLRQNAGTSFGDVPTQQIDVSKPFRYVAVSMTTPSLLTVVQIEQSDKYAATISNKALSGNSLKSEVRDDTLFVELTHDPNARYSNYKVTDWPSTNHPEIKIYCPQLKGVAVSRAYCAIVGFKGEYLHLKHEGMGLSSLNNCTLDTLDLYLNIESKTHIQKNNRLGALNARLDDYSEIRMDTMPRRTPRLVAGSQASVTLRASAFSKLREP